MLGDLRTLQNRIHYILGVFFMSIPMVLHCVLIFLPVMTGVPMNLVPGVPPSKHSLIIEALTLYSILHRFSSFFFR